MITRCTKVSLTLRGVRDVDHGRGLMVPIVIERTFIVEDPQGFPPEEANEFFAEMKVKFEVTCKTPTKA